MSIRSKEHGHDGSAAGAAGRRPWTRERVEALGMATDVPTAAEILKIGRTLAYELLKTDQFPVPILRMGARVIVPTAPIMSLLDPPTIVPGSADVA